MMLKLKFETSFQNGRWSVISFVGFQPSFSLYDHSKQISTETWGPFRSTHNYNPAAQSQITNSISIAEISKTQMLLHSHRCPPHILSSYCHAATLSTLKKGKRVMDKNQDFEKQSDRKDNKCKSTQHISKLQQLAICSAIPQSCLAIWEGTHF